MKPSMAARLLLVLLAALALATAACSRQRPDPVISSEALFGVTPFVNPTQNAEVLAGMLSDEATHIDKHLLLDLDAKLAEALAKSTEKTYVPAAKIKACLAAVPKDAEESRLTIRKYYADVGKCAKADYLVVPQASLLRERLGGPRGSDRPAKVILDIYVVDVKNGSLYRHFHFEEEQQTLADNILEVKKFVDRGGKWVTALELATEGINKGVKEIGL